MSVTRNLSRSAALLRRGRRLHRTAMASGALAAVTLLSAGCGGGVAWRPAQERGEGMSQTTPSA